MTVAAAAGAMPSSIVPDSVEVVELDRLVFSSAGSAAEMTSVTADPVGKAASKLAWVVGRRMRKLLSTEVVGEDILRGHLIAWQSIDQRVVVSGLTEKKVGFGKKLWLF